MVRATVGVMADTLFADNLAQAQAKLNGDDAYRVDVANIRCEDCLKAVEVNRLIFRSKLTGRLRCGGCYRDYSADRQRAEQAHAGQTNRANSWSAQQQQAQQQANNYWGGAFGYQIFNRNGELAGPAPADTCAWADHIFGHAMPAADRKRVYGALLKTYHPDTNGGDERCAEITRRLIAAYEKR